MRGHGTLRCRLAGAFGGLEAARRHRILAGICADFAKSRIACWIAACITICLTLSVNRLASRSNSSLLGRGLSVPKLSSDPAVGKMVLQQFVTAARPCSMCRTKIVWSAAATAATTTSITSQGPKAMR